MLNLATHNISEADLTALPGTIVWPEGGAGSTLAKDT
jgi:hypothetical protein